MGYNLKGEIQYEYMLNFIFVFNLKNFIYIDCRGDRV